MPTQVATSHASKNWFEVHPLTPEDAAAMTAMRAAVSENKGRMQGTAGRAPFDAIMERVAAPDAVTYERDTVGGIPGLWCKPENARQGEVVLHIHGGWFNWDLLRRFVIWLVISPLRLASWPLSLTIALLLNTLFLQHQKMFGSVISG